MPITCPQEFINFADLLADTAGPILRRHFQTQVPVDKKSDQTPVSIADRDAEEAMRKMISETYPGHGILGEEHGNEGIEKEYIWVNSIDGYLATIGAQIGTHFPHPVLHPRILYFHDHSWQGYIPCQ